MVTLKLLALACLLALGRSGFNIDCIENGNDPNCDVCEDMTRCFICKSNYVIRNGDKCEYFWDDDPHPSPTGRNEGWPSEPKGWESDHVWPSEPKELDHHKGPFDFPAVTPRDNSRVKPSETTEKVHPQSNEKLPEPSAKNRKWPNDVWRPKECKSADIPMSDWCERCDAIYPRYCARCDSSWTTLEKGICVWNNNFWAAVLIPLILVAVIVCVLPIVLCTCCGCAIAKCCCKKKKKPVVVKYQGQQPQPQTEQQPQPQPEPQPEPQPQPQIMKPPVVQLQAVHPQAMQPQAMQPQVMEPIIADPGPPLAGDAYYSRPPAQVYYASSEPCAPPMNV